VESFGTLTAAYAVSALFYVFACLFYAETSATQYAKVIGLHTDLAATICMMDSADEWHSALLDHHVILTTASAFLTALKVHQISFAKINLVVFDDCHLAARPGQAYSEIVDILFSGKGKLNSSGPPLVLGLTTSILDDIVTPTDLDLHLTNIENSLRSRIEMTSDAVMADPYGLRPRESVVECEEYNDTTGLITELSGKLKSALDFINDVRLTGDTGDDAAADDVKTTAKLVLTETERVLAELGPWCAARVAAAFVHQLAKLDKPSSDYRHTMLCLAATVLRSIEKTVDILFDRQVQTLEDFGLFMSPKALKLIDVLRECKPDDNFVIMSGDFDGDFQSDEEYNDSEDSMDDEPNEASANTQKSKSSCVQKIAAGRSDKNSGSSGQHYIAVRRSACTGNSDGGTQAEMTPDNEGICGIVFVSHRHIAFALNKLIVELCNWDPDLYFVRSHYIAGYVPSSATMSDAQRQKQENVLRKFRQREYNVLVATTALEEGVDLPRCNLVVRFDRPTSYCSYMLSKVIC
jgi:endoribonuclease Dicer